ncbi:hypothetical protein V7654_07765 [Bacillus sp. JJ1609]|uniref:hypothetical protein n=1 Tax=Bacillus sp. JJ1609 TaxID=3122977 RepID=UPI003000DF67
MDALKSEKQPGLAQQLIDKSLELIEHNAFEDIEKIENNFNHIFIKEDVVQDFANDIEIYFYKAYRLGGKVLCGRRLKSGGDSRFTAYFLIKHPIYSFLLDYQEQYKVFYEQLQVVDHFKLSVLYYYQNQTGL